MVMVHGRDIKHNFHRVQAAACTRWKLFFIPLPRTSWIGGVAF
jgi:hypothetical protein